MASDYLSSLGIAGTEEDEGPYGYRSNPYTKFLNGIVRDFFAFTQAAQMKIIFS